MNPPAIHASNESQRKSISLLPKRNKHVLYEHLMQAYPTYSVDDFHIASANENSNPLSVYHQISCKPIIKCAEDDMVG